MTAAPPSVASGGACASLRSAALTPMVSAICESGYLPTMPAHKGRDSAGAKIVLCDAAAWKADTHGSPNQRIWMWRRGSARLKAADPVIMQRSWVRFPPSSRISARPASQRTTPPGLPDSALAVIAYQVTLQTRRVRGAHEREHFNGQRRQASTNSRSGRELTRKASQPARGGNAPQRAISPASVGRSMACHVQAAGSAAPSLKLPDSLKRGSGSFFAS